MLVRFLGGSCEFLDAVDDGEFAFEVLVLLAFKLLGNLNSTLTQLSTTVSEVNTLVASANKTVTGVNGIIDDAGANINDTFRQII